MLIFPFCKYTPIHSNFIGTSIPQAKYLKKMKSKEEEISPLKMELKNAKEKQTNELKRHRDESTVSLRSQKAAHCERIKQHDAESSAATPKKKVSANIPIL